MLKDTDIKSNIYLVPTRLICLVSMEFCGNLIN